MSQLIEKLLNVGDVQEVVDAFSPQEKEWLQSFSDKELKDFEEAVTELLKLTDLPGRIQLSEILYDHTSTMTAWWMVDYVVGLKPGTLRFSVGGLRLRDSYKEVVERIRFTTVEF